ncbi:MAG: M15 family metallopeptidase [Clostridia bacterium]|nr:M15 family metallopeptidase [Clostridia bacterium]
MSKQERGANAKKRRRGSLFPIVLAFLMIAALAFAGGYKTGFERGNAKRRQGSSLLLVNESHPLSADYVPEELVRLYDMRHSFRLAKSDIYLTYDTYLAAQDMFAAAESENMNGYIITSGYRSYDKQAEVYAESQPGYAQKPGCSEHQTGLCFDVTVETAQGFENTPQYRWLRANAHKYGFIQRYPADKADVTGISYEPWHYRYVGADAANEMYKNSLTLEEYLGS